LLYSNSVLEKCSSLEDELLKPKFVRGEHLGRGFADLGYEQFVFLSNNQLVSLFTGDKISIDDREREHFFIIPSVDQINQHLEEKLYDIKFLNFINRREWELVVVNSDTNDELVFLSKTILEVLLESLLHIQNKNKK